MKTAAFLSIFKTEEKNTLGGLELFDKKPLFLYTLEKLVECNTIEEVHLCSDDDSVLDYADYLNYKKIKCSSNFDNSYNFMLSNLQKMAEGVDVDLYLHISVTNPFIKMSTIEEAIKIIKQKPEYNALIAVCKHNLPVLTESDFNLKDLLFEANTYNKIITAGGLLIMKKDYLRNHEENSRDTYIYEIPPLEAISTRDSKNFMIVDIIAKGLRQREADYFRLISKHMSSAMLSDIVFDLNLNSVITGLSCNIPKTCIMGRANTLKIRPLDDGERQDGIYDGLKTYSKIGNGEIIVVENECPNLAYFGNLNCNLSIRSGAVGTVIGGVTRDSDDVNALKYPVFSKGYSCKDVRGIATIDYHQRPIYISGVKICPGDLVFADSDGIVIIPKKYEKYILDRVYKTINQEENVLRRIISGQDGFEIFQNEGAF